MGQKVEPIHGPVRFAEPRKSPIEGGDRGGEA